MAATEQTTRKITVTIGLDREVSMEEYARVLVAIGQIEGVDSIAGDPAGDFGEEPRASDRLFVNEERTRLIRIWANGTVELALRESPDHTWGPPVYLTEEPA